MTDPSVLSIAAAAVDSLKQNTVGVLLDNMGRIAILSAAIFGVSVLWQLIKSLLKPWP